MEETDCKKRIHLQRVSLVLFQNFLVLFSETHELLVLNSAHFKQYFIIFKAGIDYAFKLTAFTFPSSTQPFPQKKSLNCLYL